MSRRWVWLLLPALLAVTCALDREGGGNVIPTTDGGTGGASSDVDAAPDTGIILPLDATVGH